MSNEIRITGETVVAAYQEWVKSELSDGPRQAYELGKFGFTVSLGTLGAIAAIEKLGAAPKLDAPLMISLALHLISVLVALHLAMPRVQVLAPEADLIQTHRNEVQRIKRMTWAWFTIWLIAILFGAWAVAA